MRVNPRVLRLLMFLSFTAITVGVVVTAEVHRGTVALLAWFWLAAIGAIAVLLRRR
jgi:hypothetical protein